MRTRKQRGELVSSRGCRGPHVMARAVADGWFVCVMCGQVAACPGCVDASDSMRVHLCAEHGYLAWTESLAIRTVWASEQSAR